MALVLALFVAACGEEKDERPAAAAAAASAGKDCGKVVLNEQAWAGSTANTYIAKAVLEDKLGCAGRDHEDRRDPGLPGDGRRQGRRRARGLAARRRVREVHRQGRHRRAGRAARRRGPHRLVHPEVPDGRAPRVQDLGGPEGQGGPLQDRRVRRPGHVPRRRPVLRPEGQGADRGARAQLQARDRRRRAGPGGALEPALQAEEAGHLLLVHAAVPQPGVRPGRGASCRRARTRTRTARTTPRRAATPSSTSASTT